MGSNPHDVESGGGGPTSFREGVNDSPWEAISHSELDLSAKWMSQDADLWVFRRFGRLHLFNVLCLQRLLTGLEEKLRQLVWENEEEGYPTSPGHEEAVQKLLPDIRRTLKDYDNALSRLARMNSYQKPYEHTVKHIKTWSDVYGYRTLAKELNIEDETHLKDLASIGAREKRWIHRFIDNHERLRRMFETEESRQNTTETMLTQTMLYSEVNIKRTERFLMNSTFCVLLLCPVIALIYVNNKAWKLVILAIFVLGASVLTSSFSDAADQSSLAVVAGYSAILVVFLSNNIGG